MIKHPYLIGGVVLGSLFVAYEVWGRSPGDKAQIGDTVRVDVRNLSPTPALASVLQTVAPGGLPPGTFAYVLVTSIDPSTAAINGRLVRLQLPESAIELKNTQVFVFTFRRYVLPLSYGAKPVPVASI